MRCTYSDGEPWKKVKILKDKPGNVPLERLYPDSLVPASAKVRDLKKRWLGTIFLHPSATFTWIWLIKMTMEQKQNMKTINLSLS